MADTNLNSESMSETENLRDDDAPGVEPQTTSDSVSESSETAEAGPKTKLASRRWALLVGALAVLMSGLMHGYLDGRWADRPNLERMGQRIDEIPSQVGDWELISDDGLQENEQRILQCYGSLSRTYGKPSTGDQVTALLLFGPRGPMAVHRPEICYGGGGYEIAVPRSAQSIPVNGEDNRLWRVQLRQTTQADPSIEVWYGFSDGGQWQAAKYPRVWMADRLYKIQISGRPKNEGDEKSPAEDFLDAFLPIVNEQTLRKG